MRRLRGLFCATPKLPLGQAFQDETLSAKLCSPMSDDGGWATYQQLPFTFVFSYPGTVLKVFKTRHTHTNNRNPVTLFRILLLPCNCPPFSCLSAPPALMTSPTRSLVLPPPHAAIHGTPFRLASGLLAAGPPAKHAFALLPSAPVKHAQRLMCAPSLQPVGAPGRHRAFTRASGRPIKRAQRLMLAPSLQLVGKHLVCTRASGSPIRAGSCPPSLDMQKLMFGKPQPNAPQEAVTILACRARCTRRRRPRSTSLPSLVAPTDAPCNPLASLLRQQEQTLHRQEHTIRRQSATIAQLRRELSSANRYVRALVSRVNPDLRTANHRDAGCPSSPRHDAVCNSPRCARHSSRSQFVFTTPPRAQVAPSRFPFPPLPMSPE